MKVLLVIVLSLLLLILASCEKTNILEEGEPTTIGQATIAKHKAAQLPPEGCEQYQGGPENGPTSGCHSSSCTGSLTLTVSNWNCEEDDCYLLLRKLDLDESNPIEHYPCTHNGNEICIDADGTYSFVVDMSHPWAPFPAHSYLIHGFLGHAPNNQNNKVKLTWSGAANGSSTVRYLDPFPYNITPRGYCN